MLQTFLRELLAHALPVERLQAYLPMHTVLRRGNDHVHIVNASIFTAETQYHTIYEGMTLCARRKRGMSEPRKGEGVTCPGCVAHAKGIVLRTIAG
jgi:hypothetical protein